MKEELKIQKELQIKKQKTKKKKLSEALRKNLLRRKAETNNNSI